MYFVFEKEEREEERERERERERKKKERQSNWSKLLSTADPVLKWKPASPSFVFVACFVYFIKITQCGRKGAETRWKIKKIFLFNSGPNFITCALLGLRELESL